jgi:hypothetical protein
MNAGQYEGIINLLADIRDRMPEPKTTTAAPVPRPFEPAQSVSASPLDREGKWAASMALYALLVSLDGWIAGARENHDALDHRNEPTGEECWTRWHPADIRSMVNDVARELGLGEFPRPAVPKEEEVR